MEFAADITDCIKLLEGSGKENEGALAEELQKCVKEFLNIEQKSALKCDKDLKDGEDIEEGEIIQEEGEIENKSQEILEFENISLSEVREQFLSCKFCPFIKTLKKPELVSDKDILPTTRQPWHPMKDFRDHIRSEHSMCEICEIIFDSKDNLEDHIESHNPEEGVLLCNFNGCSQKKVYKNFTALFSHAQKNHHKGKLFKCNLCTKSFNEIGQSRDHDKRHNGVGQYSCPLCGITYPKTKFATHLKIQHDNTCSICRKTFSKSHNFLNHLQTHTKQKLTHVKCFKCSIYFLNMKELKKHVKGFTHTGIKPFLCNLCQKTFSSQYNVRKHLTKTGRSRCNMLPKQFPFAKELQLEGLDKETLNDSLTASKETENVTQEINSLVKFNGHAQKTVDSITYSCPKCGFTTKAKSKFYRDMVIKRHKEKLHQQFSNY